MRLNWMVKKFYFDTYALIEISKGNPKYEPYKEGIKVILNKLNLLEFSYFVMREGKANYAKEIFNNFPKFNVDYDEEILIKAAEMRFRFSKEKLSFIDCIGYNLAKKNNAKFLTGDEKFRHKEGVEFVK
jgi:predicted nucleic acid-binding protein